MFFANFLALNFPLFFGVGIFFSLFHINFFSPDDEERKKMIMVVNFFPLALFTQFSHNISRFSHSISHHWTFLPPISHYLSKIESKYGIFGEIFHSLRASARRHIWCLMGEKSETGWGQRRRMLGKTFSTSNKRERERMWCTTTHNNILCGKCLIVNVDVLFVCE
jgi:hypothetical protein